MALSTKEALEILKNNKYAVIISDMKRKESDKEGYILLDEIRKIKNEIYKWWACICVKNSNDFRHLNKNDERFKKNNSK